MKSKLKRPKSSDYGSLTSRQASMPNLSKKSINANESSSDLEEDPVANNCEITYLLDSVDNTPSRPPIKKNSKQSSYVIEPMAFIQNLASSIMTISIGQFIYNRIYNRLVKETIDNDNGNNTSMNTSYLNPVPLQCNMTTSNQSFLHLYSSFGYLYVKF